MARKCLNTLGGRLAAPDWAVSAVAMEPSADRGDAKWQLPFDIAAANRIRIPFPYGSSRRGNCVHLAGPRTEVTNCQVLPSGRMNERTALSAILAWTETRNSVNA